MVVTERVAILMGSPHGGVRHLVVGYVKVLITVSGGLVEPVKVKIYNLKHLFLTKARPISSQTLHRRFCWWQGGAQGADISALF